jgi:hypothetical protein
MRKALKALLMLSLLMAAFAAGPVAVLLFGNLSERGSWHSASRESTGISPLPNQESRAVVQVFSARTLGWRGAFGVHTWISTKRSNATNYVVHQVIGWRYYYGERSPVVTRTGTPDFRWFGAIPDVLVDERGAGVDAMIDKIEQAVTDYPFADFYRVWPGPNSNTFTAFVGRQVPGLKLDLPPNALGKDYLGPTSVFANAPSNTGWQFSVFGVAGILAAAREGIEVNLLGLSAGVDIDDAALRLPGIGKWPNWSR